MNNVYLTELFSSQRKLALETAANGVFPELERFMKLPNVVNSETQSEDQDELAAFVIRHMDALSHALCSYIKSLCSEASPPERVEGMRKSVVRALAIVAELLIPFARILGGENDDPAETLSGLLPPSLMTEYVQYAGHLEPNKALQWCFVRIDAIRNRFQRFWWEKPAAGRCQACDVAEDLLPLMKNLLYLALIQGMNNENILCYYREMVADNEIYQ